MKGIDSFYKRRR